jgi:hypothetical protein
VASKFPQGEVRRAVGVVFGIAAIDQRFGPLIGKG